MMRLWIGAFGLALILAPMVASGQCDDTIYQNYIASFAPARHFHFAAVCNF